MIVFGKLMRSWTFWTNFISAILEIIQSIMGMNIIPTGALLITVNVINIVLRVFKTYIPIWSKGEEEKPIDPTNTILK